MQPPMQGKTQSINPFDISYTTSTFDTAQVSSICIYIYKANAAKAKTTDRAMAIELTMVTEDPGAFPVA